jgi:hypothetical protein
MPTAPNFLRLWPLDSDDSLARIQAIATIDTRREEQRCLGAATVDNTLLGRSLSELEPEDFSELRHHDLFVLMRYLYKVEGGFDIDALCNRLSEQNMLRNMGGRSYLRQLLRLGEKTVGAVAPSADLLLRLARARRASKAPPGTTNPNPSDPAPPSAGASPPSPEDSAATAANPAAPGDTQPAATTNTTVPNDPSFTTISAVKSVPVEWLWEPYLALGTLAILSGEPGCGTTYLALDIAAAITEGTEVFSSSASTPSGASGVPEADGVAFRPKTDDQRPTTAVIYLGTDCPERVLKPRFEMLKGNPDRLHLLSPPQPLSRFARNQGHPPPQTFLQSLESALISTAAKLVVVDTLQAFVGPAPNQLSLDGLRRLAAQYNCCILLVRHINRARTGRVRVRTMSNLDLVGAASTELLAGVSNFDPEWRVLTHVRSNIGPLGEAQGYEIGEDGDFYQTGPCEAEASCLLAPPIHPDQRGALQEAINFLADALREGGLRAVEVFRRAKEKKISVASLQRAKACLGVRSRRLPRECVWYWYRPGTEGEWGEAELEELARNDEDTAKDEQSEPQDGPLDRLELTGFYVKFAHLATIEKVNRFDPEDKPRDPRREDFSWLVRHNFNLLRLRHNLPRWTGEGPCGSAPNTMEEIEQLGVTRKQATFLVDLYKSCCYPLDYQCGDCLDPDWGVPELYAIAAKLLGESPDKYAALIAKNEDEDNPDENNEDQTQTATCAQNEQVENLALLKNDPEPSNPEAAM